MGLSIARKPLAGAAIVLALGGIPSAAAEREAFPSVRPATREQAVTVLSGGAPVRSLTPLVLSNWSATDASPAVRRALGVLAGPDALLRERRVTLTDGTTLRYTTSRGSFDRIDTTDADEDGRPDVLAAAIEGLADGRALLVDALGLTAPEPVEILLARIGPAFDGYLVPAVPPASRARIALHAAPGTDPETVRREALRQYAFATGLAAGPALPPSWGEALATWTEMRMTGGPHLETARLLSGRLHRLAEGLLTDGLDLAAGNALWLAWLEEAHGTSPVRLTIEELASGRPAAGALDAALRRGAGATLPQALRDFQLWGVLVGDRSDRRHYSFAERLESPRFAHDSEGLPALSVQGGPAVAPLGGALVRLRPDATDGGLRIHFEGDFATTWGVDLLVVGRGTLRRLPLAVGTDGRAEVTVPLPGLAEALLLVRNLGDEGEPRRYSWSADHERGFPYELTALQATVRGTGEPGATISWETRLEQNLVGFNVLRLEEGERRPLQVNPVWIPAMGNGAEPTSYQFLDAGAKTGVAYTYRVQGITLEGLPSLSPPVVAAPAR